MSGYIYIVFVLGVEYERSYIRVLGVECDRLYMCVRGRL